jgi:ornithine decarboxylase
LNVNAPLDIVFANPCKPKGHIAFARSIEVNTLTFDNVDELRKINSCHPGSDLLLRIWTDDSAAQSQLNNKFGAPMECVRSLLVEAKTLGLNVVGVSFHVGSGCQDPIAYVSAIDRARSAFDIGHQEGFQFTTLDVGGGFTDANFEMAAAALRREIDEQFPQSTGVRIIAEPGRFFVGPAFTLATKVIGRRIDPGDDCSKASHGCM